MEELFPLLTLKNIKAFLVSKMSMIFNFFLHAVNFVFSKGSLIICPTPRMSFVFVSSRGCPFLEELTPQGQTTFYVLTTIKAKKILFILS